MQIAISEGETRLWPKANGALNPNAGLLAKVKRPPPTFASLAPEYARLWDSIQLKREMAGAAGSSAAKVLANRARYENVQNATGVPWYVVGLIHAMECGLDFTRHLHNGDRLSGRTHQAPAGRPVKGSPPFTWLDSAIDAIEYDGLSAVKSWTVERLCFVLEKFNGWGYRPHGVPTPYLWSGSNHYRRGKYVRDGVWDPDHVSRQSGAMVILARLMVLCPDIHMAREGATEQRPGVKELPQSGTITGAVLAAFAAAATWLLDAIPDVINAAHAVRDNGSDLLELIGFAGPKLAFTYIFIGLAIVVSRRVSAAIEGRIA